LNSLFLVKSPADVFTDQEPTAIWLNISITL